MSRPDDGSFDFALFYGFGDWSILVHSSDSAQTSVTIDMDLGRYSEVLTGVTDGVIAGAFITNGWVNTINNRCTLSTSLEGWTHDIALTGTTAAILKVKNVSPMQAAHRTMPAFLLQPVHQNLRWYRNLSKAIPPVWVQTVRLMALSDHLTYRIGAMWSL
ncbi:MAG: hypothetical protein COA78_38315 [Blastopirellula sp.]|nr:MAG: hypothetical protein COA78_38315 [Blastopirellula sp.]